MLLQGCVHSGSAVIVAEMLEISIRTMIFPERSPESIGESGPADQENHIANNNRNMGCKRQEKNRSVLKKDGLPGLSDANYRQHTAFMQLQAYPIPFRMRDKPVKLLKNRSKSVNVFREGPPSLMRRVLLISLGMTILPKSSTLRTIPVAFIYLLSSKV